MCVPNLSRKEHAPPAQNKNSRGNWHPGCKPWPVSLPAPRVLSRKRLAGNASGTSLILAGRLAAGAGEPADRRQGSRETFHRFLQPIPLKGARLQCHFLCLDVPVLDLVRVHGAFLWVMGASQKLGDAYRSPFSVAASTAPRCSRQEGRRQMRMGRTNQPQHRGEALRGDDGDV
jgi:hypothetical protein